jgi:phage terminase Nu1 subunit (DNA packaging protein)
MPSHIRGGQTYFRWLECLQWREEQIRSQARHGIQKEDINLTEERARLTKEKADAQEMENAIRSEEWIHLEDMEKLVRRSLGRVNAVLRKAPEKHGPELSERTGFSTKEARRFLGDLIESMRADLRALPDPLD